MLSYGRVKLFLVREKSGKRKSQISGGTDFSNEHAQRKESKS